MVESVLDLMDFLYSSDSNDGNVCIVRVEDKGSKPLIVMVDVHVVPARGITDSGADITIINGDFFQKLATVARLKKSAFKKPDGIPVTYDQKPFTLHGRMDLDIIFNDKTMSTAVYIKWTLMTRCYYQKGMSPIRNYLLPSGHRGYHTSR